MTGERGLAEPEPAHEDLRAGAPGSFSASPAVQRWLAQTGGGTPAERAHALEMLERFCAHEGASPDELVARCLRSTKSGGTAISAAGRRGIDQEIRAFVAAEGLVGHQAIVLGNQLRGFLIHNGIFLQGPASIT